MLPIRHLRVQNIRSHQDYTVAITEGVTVITGPNGSGKTSLLEALYIALQGTSFKGSDSDALRKDAPWWRIDITTAQDGVRTVTFDPARTTKRKQFTIDDTVIARLGVKHKYPVVLFEPDDLRLLHGSPARRRSFIDRFISQLNPLYATAVRKYERALKQRNNLLKRDYVREDELFAWDIALAEHGAYMIDQRIAFIEALNKQLTDAYNDIAHSHDDITIHYSHTFVGDVKQKLLSELYAHREKDGYLGVTTVGPHRHDIMFSINNSPAIATASRGEARTIMLALKFLEVGIIEEVTGLKPLILLDDVFSELDVSRQQALSSRTKEHQIVMTSTHVVSSDRSFTHIELS